MEPAIFAADGGRRLGDFTGLPFRLYRNAPLWVPQLIMDVKSILDKKKNPFFAHGEAQYFVAYNGKEPVGRVAAIIDRNYNKYHNVNAGWFGFFECINDRDTAKALMRSAFGWLKDREMNVVYGPASPTLNDEAGMLLEGYDKSPCIMMPYNPPYYHELMAAVSMEKAKDLYAWYLSSSVEPTERISRIVERIKKRDNITLRPLDMKHFRRDLDIVKAIYNSAWEQNWDFASMTDAELEYTAAKLKPIVMPEMVQFIEIDGRAVAVAIVMPDINIVLKKMGGRLFPFGLLKFLYYRRKITEVRLMILGVLPEYRGRGYDAVLYHAMLMTAKKVGITGGELSWTLEDNDAINKGIEAMGGKIYKKYRVYKKDL